MSNDNSSPTLSTTDGGDHNITTAIKYEQQDHITAAVETPITAAGTPCCLTSNSNDDSFSLPLVSQQRNLLTGGVPLPHTTGTSTALDQLNNFNQHATQQQYYNTASSTTGTLQHSVQLQHPKVVPFPHFATTNTSANIRAHSPTFSDVSSILLPPVPTVSSLHGNMESPFMKLSHHPHKRSHPHTLPPLSGVSSSTDSLSADESITGGAHGMLAGGHILSPTAIGQINKKRAFSNSPLSDMTTADINSLIRASPNSLIYNTASSAFPFTNTVPLTQPPPHGAIGHLVQPPQPPSHQSQLQYTIKERKMSIERNQNFTNGTFDTTITNRVTYSEKPPPLLPTLSHHPHLLIPQPHAGPEAMEIGLPHTIIPNKVHSPNSNNTEYTDASSEEPVACLWNNCNQQMSSISELVHHIEKCHVEKSMMEDYVCLWRDCPRRRKPFNARYKLVIHMRIHSGEKPNKCSYPGCPKAFSRLENLKIHMRTHTGEKPYSCQFNGCDKSFSNSSDRSKHQKTHFEQKPYACTHPGCDKRYTDPSSLRKHSRTHTQRKTSNESPLTDCLHIHSLNTGTIHASGHTLHPLSDNNRKLNRKQKELIVVPKQEVPLPPSLIHFPSIDPFYAPPTFYNTYQLAQPPPPTYSIAPPYDSTHYYNSPPTQSLPSPGKPPHGAQLQLSVNGYSHIYDEQVHPLSHYPDHPPPRYEESFYDNKPHILHHPNNDTTNVLPTTCNTTCNTTSTGNVLYNTVNYYM